MRCLVSGGAGFIGSNLVKLLVEHNERVTILDNLSTGQICNLRKTPGDFTFYCGDIRNSRDVQKAVGDGVDTIFHIG